MRVFDQNESCLLVLSFLHNLSEDGGKDVSSHFDETLIWKDTIVNDLKSQTILLCHIFLGEVFWCEIPEDGQR